MDERSLTLFKYSICPEKFAKTQKQERTFFLKALNAATDINFIQKIMIFATRGISQKEIGSLENSAQITMSFCLMRLLAGILRETFNLIQVGFYAEARGDKDRIELIKKENLVDISINYRPPVLREEAFESLENSRKYFDAPGMKIINRIRDKFAFHYDFAEALKGDQNLTVIDDLDLFLEESDANCLYYFADRKLIYDILNSIGYSADQLKEGMDAILKDLKEQARNLSHFLNGFCVAFCEKYPINLSDDCPKIKLSGLLFLEEVELPYFVKKSVTVG